MQFKIIFISIRHAIVCHPQILYRQRITKSLLLVLFHRIVYWSTPTAEKIEVIVSAGSSHMTVFDLQ